MPSLHEKMARFLKSESGPTSLEYAVMVATVIVIALGAMRAGLW